MSCDVVWIHTSIGTKNLFLLVWVQVRKTGVTGIPTLSLVKNKKETQYSQKTITIIQDTI